MLISNIPSMPGITETFAWVTQVITAYDGHEERHRIRLKPRMTYQVTIPLATKSAVDDLKTRDDKLRDNLEFVVWHAPYLDEARLATKRGHPWYFEFGDKVAHYRAGVGVTISESVVGAGIIYPVRDAIVDGELKYTIRRGGGRANITYNVQEAVEPPTGSFNTQLIDGVTYEVLEMPTRSGFSQAVVQNQSYFDSIVGAYIGTTRWDRPKLKWTYTVELFEPTDVLAWKQFLFRRAGRLNPVVIRDTDGRSLIMRLATDVPAIVYNQGYYTSSVPFIEIFT